MANKKLFYGIAAGVAALAVVGLVAAKQRSKRKFESQVDEAKQNFKSKLSELQRKAKKEYKNSGGETKDAVNSAKERANEWVNK